MTNKFSRNVSVIKFAIASAIIAISGNISPVNAAEAASGKPDKSFVVIDSIHYLDKGDLSVYGLKDYTIFYGVHIWPKDIRKKEKRPLEAPSDEHIASIVKNITTAKSPVIYDIEHWPLDILSTVQRCHIVHPV